MELIAASRIQKALARVQASAPYARAVTRAVSAVATYSNVNHVLTTEPEKIERAAILIFASDRGLAGAFNANVLKESEELATLLRGQGKEVVYYVVGRRAVGLLRVPQARDRAGLDRRHRQPELRDRAGDRRGAGRQVRAAARPRAGSTRSTSSTTASSAC